MYAKKIFVKDEEEVPYDPKYEKEEGCEFPKTKTPNYEEEFFNAFLNLPIASQANAKSFDYSFDLRISSG